jgi:hypothetical protein
MDYEVFLVSRMHEEWLKLKDNDAAVRIGQAITGKTISAAAAIMIVVFSSFVITTDRTIKMIGLGMAVAILIDALLIRTVLVPAVMHTFGKMNWALPGFLDRRLPRLSLEGDEQPGAVPARNGRAFARAYPSAPSAASTVLGTTQTTTPDVAAFINGTMVRYFDYNDGYIGKEVGHPSDGLKPCIAALATALRARSLPTYPAPRTATSSPASLWAAALPAHEPLLNRKRSKRPARCAEVPIAPCCLLGTSSRPT